jgi:protein-S-isoprenylcysteine O-methyltransferase Ste14
MKRTLIIDFFLIGLLLLAIFEVVLIWLLDKAAGSPMVVFASINVFLGLFAITIGSLLILWSVWFQFSIGKGTPVPLVETQKLVVTGPYAYSRNPMTLGAAALYSGISILYGSLLVFLLVMLVFAALLTYIHKHETRELSERFGVEYLAYKDRTSFLIPVPRFWKHK